MKVAARTIITHGEQVLLGMRSSGIEAGKWNIFGGKPDDNETPEQAAVREVFEESGILLPEVKLLFEDTHNGWLSYIFLAIVTDKNYGQLSETTQARWFSPQELDEIHAQIAFNHYRILQAYFNVHKP